MGNYSGASQTGLLSRETSHYSRADWLKHPLYLFGDGDEWTVKDAVEGTQVFGATGSGKSSGSGRALACGLIEAGLGGVVLAAKSDELDQWLTYFRQAGEPDPIGAGRLRVIEPGGIHRFDPLAYEFGLAADGGTRRLTNLFMTALGSGDGRVSSDPYWDDALRQLLGHAIDLVVFGEGTVGEDGCLKMRQSPPSLAEIAEVVKSSAISADEARSSRWLDSDAKCPALLRKLDANHRKLGKDEWAIEADMRDTFGYWSREFPSLADRTRSVILTSFTGKANDLLRRPLRELFCSGDSLVDANDEESEKTVSPKATHDGVVVLLNIPVKRYGEVGEFAQKLYKTVWQHATESDERDTNQPGTKPTFLWADEAQHFVTKEDVLFQATARSKLAATVYLTQNISNYYTVLGGHQSSATDALLGSLQMKIFHANGDPATNEWAERLFGTMDIKDELGSRNIGKEASRGTTESIRTQRVIAGWKFTTLNRGTGAKGSSGAYICHGGKEWEEPVKVKSVSARPGVKPLVLANAKRHDF